MINNASERLQKNNSKIMRSWEQRAKREVDAALDQKSLALQNSLPEYLSQLSTALSTTINRTGLRKKFDLEESERIGKKHGRERASSVNYTMDQMIYEYHILRQVIFDVMEEEAPITDIEREIIICSIEQAVNDAATQFSDTLREVQEYLTRTVAHDLRNPITAAKLGAEMISKRPENADQSKKTAMRIVNSMERLDLMIHDLLDASRLQAGQSLPLRFEECDLNFISQQIAHEFASIYEDRFNVESLGVVSGFWCKNGLSRVIENLVTNAVKYGDPKTPISIRLKKNEQSVQLSVHNHGIPIPPEEQAILFQQYRRSKSNEGKTGWGLGLAVVKGIVEGHKGSISVVSTEGKGTTFSILLPDDSRN